MLEGPLPASPVPVVRGLGHFPPADRQGRLAVARNRDRGQSGSRDHLKVFQSLQNIQELHVVYQVPRHAARPDRVRLHEDHRPVQAGDGGPGRAAECGGAAGPGPVHPRRLRQEQIHQPADQVRSGERQFALLFFRLAELNKHSQTSFSRFGRLLLVIPLLRMVKATLVETLFFRETVGETNIKNIILGKMTK